MKVSHDTVPVTELITVIKNSIKTAGVSSTTLDTDLKVSRVQLKLAVVASSILGAGFDIRVPVIGMCLRAGAKVTHRDTHALDITLCPPSESDDDELRDGDIEDTLVDAINTIHHVVQYAAEGDDPWILSAGKVDISFAVTDTGSLTLGVDGELSDEVTHSLCLGLAAKPLVS